MKIILADDHTIIRKGLTQLISEMSFPEKVEVIEAGLGSEVIQFINDDEYDIIILDISLPDDNGLDILKKIKEIKSDQKVLMLSMYPENQFAVRALKSGASGYLTKDCAPDQLYTALQKIIAGKKYISSNLADLLLDRFDDDLSKLPHEYLSDREIQVLTLLAKGKSQTEIAEKLFLSIKTISTYRSRILAKLDLKNNSELINYAINNKLV